MRLTLPPTESDIASPCEMAARGEYASHAKVDSAIVRKKGDRAGLTLTAAVSPQLDPLRFHHWPQVSFSGGSVWSTGFLAGTRRFGGGGWAERTEDGRWDEAVERLGDGGVSIVHRQGLPDQLSIGLREAVVGSDLP